MQVVSKLNMKTPKEILEDKGLLEGGNVQKFIDSECIRLVEPYVPMKSGTLTQSTTYSTVIGSGYIVQKTPYARFQYYGKVMTTEDGRVWAHHGEKKPIITNRDLQYDTSKHPLAGSHWWDRMKADKGKELLKSVKEYVRKGSE